MVKLITWNIARREDAWRFLLDTDADIALLQEAAEPPSDIAERFDVDPAPWLTPGAIKQRRWRAAIVKLSDRVDVQWLEAKSLHEARSGELAVSWPGTLAAAIVTPTSTSIEPFIVASMYALWERRHTVTGSGGIYADGSVHRLISDLSALVGKKKGQRILAAGDLNVLYGHGERGRAYWASRYATVFNRMSALGLPFVGPQAPAGRQAEPWPDELPEESRNVPTYHTSRMTPATATRQLDFVFASNSLVKHVRTKALNDPDQWGPSDHCRVEIEVT